MWGSYYIAPQKITSWAWVLNVRQLFVLRSLKKERLKSGAEEFLKQTR